MTINRWSQRPQGATWGDWGPDDQQGRMNLITDEVRLRGIRSVDLGELHMLSLPLDYPVGSPLNKARKAPIIRPTLRSESVVNYNVDLGRIEEGRTDVLSDDLAVLHLQHSTQWDSFAHVGSRFDVRGSGETEMVYYNGYRAGVDIIGTSSVDEAGMDVHQPLTGTSRANALGIEKMAAGGVQGPAKMVDLERHFGASRQRIGYDQWMHALNEDSIRVESGDMLLVHTGFSEVIMDHEGNPPVGLLAETGALLDGTDERLKQWFTDSGVAAVAGDSYSLEHYPAALTESNSALLPLHEHCLFRLGMHIGELWRLTPLAKRLKELGRTDFLLTAPPLNLPGAVGSPVTPVATI